MIIEPEEICVPVGQLCVTVQDHNDLGTTMAVNWTDVPEIAARSFAGYPEDAQTPEGLDVVLRLAHEDFLAESTEQNGRVVIYAAIACLWYRPLPDRAAIVAAVDAAMKQDFLSAHLLVQLLETHTVVSLIEQPDADDRLFH